MLFNSVNFITVFLPLSLLGWYLLQRLENAVYAKIFMVFMSFWFYGAYNLSYLWILLASLCFNYGVSALFERVSSAGGRGRLLAAGITGNLGLLFYFKYFDFFIDNCNYLLHTNISLENIALPLGISFFTFQQLSFTIERYKREAPHYNIADYAFFICFFPQLVAGPIVLHSELIPQLQKRENRRPSWEKFYDGLSLFILGLAKKVLLADSLAILVNAEYDNINMLDVPTAWIVIIWYMAELYFDFSGYCDMARGIAGMFGFWLPENFNSPFYAESVKDFWRRWHMTLTRFLTRYIYIPLGGNRKGKARQCLNLLIVFLVSGLWHGANWTFVIWGLMHGLAAVFETVFPKVRFRKKWANRLVTFLFVTLSFSIFRSESLAQAGLLWRKLFTSGNQKVLYAICNTLILPETFVLRRAVQILAPEKMNLFFLCIMLFLSAVSFVLICGRKAQDWIEKNGCSIRGTLILAFLFTWSFISLSHVSVFLYFNF